MIQIVLIGLGAGAASALLFASIASGSPLSFALANFAQLPILLAAIGWTHVAGLLAAARRDGGSRRRHDRVRRARVLSQHRIAGMVDRLPRIARAPGRDTIRTRSNGIRLAASWCGPQSRPRLSSSSRCCATDSTPRRFKAACGANWSAPCASSRARRRTLRSRCRRVKDPERLLDILVLVVPPMKATALTVTSLINLWLAALDRAHLGAAEASLAANLADDLSALHADRC